MLNGFEKKKYPLEDYDSTPEPFDPRIKQIETIRKNRLVQLEKKKKEAKKNLIEYTETFNAKKMEIIQEALYYSMLEPFIEKRFLVLSVNAPGLSRWMDEVKLLRQLIIDTHAKHNVIIQEWLGYKNAVREAEEACQAMLIKVEKLAILENIWLENGGL
jgi:hypothetical protein